MGSSFNSLTNIVQQIYSLYAEMLQTNGGKEVEKGRREKKEIYWDKSLVSAEKRVKMKRENDCRKKAKNYTYLTPTHKRISVH